MNCGIETILIPGFHDFSFRGITISISIVKDFGNDFSKKHKLGFTSDNPLDVSPICFKGRMGQKEALREITGWQDKLRDYIDELINKKPS